MPLCQSLAGGDGGKLDAESEYQSQLFAFNIL
jgi:hypothetical protein